MHARTILPHLLGRRQTRPPVSITSDGRKPRATLPPSPLRPLPPTALAAVPFELMRALTRSMRAGHACWRAKPTAQIHHGEEQTWLADVVSYLLQTTSRTFSGVGCRRCATLKHLGSDCLPGAPHPSPTFLMEYLRKGSQWVTRAAAADAVTMALTCDRRKNHRVLSIYDSVIGGLAG